jgi:hypothetical protein
MVHQSLDLLPAIQADVLSNLAPWLLCGPLGFPSKRVGPPLSTHPFFVHTIPDTIGPS